MAANSLDGVLGRLRLLLSMHRRDVRNVDVQEVGGTGLMAHCTQI